MLLVTMIHACGCKGGRQAALLKRVEAALEVLDSSDRLAVDANGAFDRTRALAYAWALEPFRLRWFEEPTDPLDFALLAELMEHYTAPIGTGENLFSTQDGENLVRFGRLRPDRDISADRRAAVVRHRAVHAHARDARAPRLEAKLDLSRGGNQMTLHIVGGFALGGCEAYPGVFGPFAGFADGRESRQRLARAA